jgi:hypothetical protein
MRRWFVLIGLGLAPLGCGTETRATSEAVLDSAGVRVVRTVDEGFARPSDVTLTEPIWRVGWDDTGALFSRLGSGVLRSNDAVVADPEATTIYRVSLEGEVLDSIGRRGDGPGEYRSLSSLIRQPEDSLLVLDRGLMRLTTLGPDLTFVRSVGFTEDPSRGGYDPWGATDGGTVIWRVYSWSPRTEGGWKVFPVLGSQGRHESFDTLATYRFIELTEQDGRARSSPAAPLGRQAATDRGYARVATDSAWVRWYDELGNEYQRLTWAEEAPTADDEWYEALVDTRVAYSERLGVRDEQLARFRESLNEQRALMQSHAPIIRDILPASSGDVWVQEWSAEIEVPDPEFFVIGPDARCRLRVSASNRFRFLDADSRFVLGVELNEFDVHSLVLYPAPECPNV